MKTCTKCGETKPLDAFHRDRSRADGRVRRCRECVAEHDRRYREENLDKELERSRRYYEENRDKARERKRRYWEENRDYFRAANRVNRSESQAMSAEMATVPLHTRWAAEEDAFLMADNGMTVFQKAIHLGRTYHSCTGRRHHLRQVESA